MATSTKERAREHRHIVEAYDKILDLVTSFLAHWYNARCQKMTSTTTMSVSESFSWNTHHSRIIHTSTSDSIENEPHNMQGGRLPTLEDNSGYTVNQQMLKLPVLLCSKPIHEAHTHASYTDWQGLRWDGAEPLAPPIVP
jgi:hypothetical protein